MALARQDYIAPWWTYWLHNFPHVNFRLKAVESDFKPEDANYQQSLIFLACVSAIGLCLSLLVLSVYLTCLFRCQRKEDEEVKRPDTCCVTWAAVITGLVICSSAWSRWTVCWRTTPGTFLDLTHFSDRSLCVFYISSLSEWCKARLPVNCPGEDFAAFVEWVLVNNGSLFTVCPTEDNASPLPTQRPASQHGASACHQLPQVSPCLRL